MLDIRDWDEAYIDAEVCGTDEHGELERKAGTMFAPKATGGVHAKTVDEIAKQVSAFANTRPGVLVFGVDDRGSLDEGVPDLIGDQTVKDWVEAIIPKQLTPTVVGCSARLIKLSRHSPDRGLLAISIPLSQRRPHWVSGKNGAQTAYLRGGAHSFPMEPQTLIDIATRTSAGIAEIGDINQSEDLENRGGINTVYIWPTVTLISGTVATNG